LKISTFISDQVLKMDKRIANLLNEWGAHLPAFEQVVVGNEERFANYVNGYNNTHEATYLLRLAALHLICARLNGEHKDEFRMALESLSVIDTLIENICTDDKFDKSYDSSHEQMRKRFDRVWGHLPPKEK